VKCDHCGKQQVVSAKRT